MSTYTVNIEGETPADNGTALVAALDAITSDPANGVTSGAVDYSDSTSVELALPTPAAPTVDELLATLEDDAAALDPSDAGAEKVQDDVKELAAAIAAQSASSSPASPAPAEPAAAPATGADGVPVAL